jgi:hypothetical protein
LRDVSINWQQGAAEKQVLNRLAGTAKVLSRLYAFFFPSEFLGMERMSLFRAFLMIHLLEEAKTFSRLF